MKRIPPMIFKATIEMSTNSLYKYEHDKVNNILVLDRPLNQSVPHNYGYLNATLSEDNDPLDVLVISNYPVRPLTEIKVNIHNIMYCNDNGVPDHKIIATLKDENITRNWSVELESIYKYLSTYKEGFEVVQTAGLEQALNEISICQKRYQDQLVNPKVT
jgi:inorganic pyrophosphatase